MLSIAAELFWDCSPGWQGFFPAYSAASAEVLALGGLGMTKQPLPSRAPALQMQLAYSTKLTQLWEWRWPSVSYGLGSFDGRNSYAWRNDVIRYDTMPSAFPFIWTNCNSTHEQQLHILFGRLSRELCSKLTKRILRFNKCNWIITQDLRNWKILGGVFLNGPGVKTLRITVFKSNLFFSHHNLNPIIRN